MKSSVVRRSVTTNQQQKITNFNLLYKIILLYKKVKRKQKSMNCNKIGIYINIIIIIIIIIIIKVIISVIL